MIRFLVVLLTVCLAGLLPASCSGPEPRQEGDSEFLHLTEAAQEAFCAGRAERAAVLFRQARQRAWILDDAAAMGDAAYNLAACLLSLGEADPARLYLAEALDQARRTGSSPADALLLDAEAARLQGKSAEADQICLQVLSLPDRMAAESRRLQAMLLRARLACDSGAAEEAVARLEEADDLLSDVRLPRLTAAAARLEGEVHMMAGAWGKAGDAFDREAGSWKEAGIHREMAGALVRAGECYKDAGEPGRAVDRLVRATRSLFAQGEKTTALVYAELSLDTAEQAGDEAAVRRCQALLDEVRLGIDREKEERTD